jgi:hypothetical protein
MVALAASSAHDASIFWYFFVTDLVKSGQVKIKYCLIQDMVSDYFTKPLQGTSFRKLCQLIMNVDKTTYDPSATCRSVLEPREPMDKVLTCNKTQGL